MDIFDKNSRKHDLISYENFSFEIQASNFFWDFSRFWLFSRAQKREKHIHLIGHTLIDFWVCYSRIYTRKSRTKIIFWSKFRSKVQIFEMKIWSKFWKFGKNFNIFAEKSVIQIEIEVLRYILSIWIWKTDFLAKILEFFPEFWKKFWSDFPSRDGCLVGGFEQSYQTFWKRCSEMSLGNRQAIGLFFKKCIFLVSASLSQFSKSNVRISKISSKVLYVDSVKIPYKP